MKINFPLPTDHQRHRYCISCNSEAIQEEMHGDDRYFKCDTCGSVNPRLIDIDPKIIWWVDPITNEYWHESIGVFVFNKQSELLLIKRTIYPVAYTIPAGHLDTGESHLQGALRELYEETGISVKELNHFMDIDILDDKCRRGADSHKWHVYTLLLAEVQTTITPDASEGKDPVWVDYGKVLDLKLTAPVEFLIRNFGDRIISNTLT